MDWSGTQSMNETHKQRLALVSVSYRNVVCLSISSCWQVFLWLERLLMQRLSLQVKKSIATQQGGQDPISAKTSGGGQPVNTSTPGSQAPTNT